MHWCIQFPYGTSLHIPFCPSFLHATCTYILLLLRNSNSFSVMSFEGAACYVFAYGWGRGQPVVLSDPPIGSKCLHALFRTHKQCGRAIQLASLSQLVVITAIGLSPLPAHRKRLQYRRLSQRHSQEASLVPSATGVTIIQPGFTLRWLTSPVLCLTCLRLCPTALEL